MRKLGISVYPEKSKYEDIIKYIDKAHSCGFSRIFTCLLSVSEDKEAIKSKLTSINEYAKSKGFFIIVDVSPRVFEALNISYKDLSFFKEIGADGLRLDQGFTGLEESMMTYNEFDLKIEINMSMDTNTIDTIMDYRPNKYNILGCHNFYPHDYSALQMDFFTRCTDRFTKYGIRVAAFVTTQNKDTFGPWPVTDGLPTLEIHRRLPLATQVKHLIALECIDDIIISNCYPSDEEMEIVSSMRLDMVTFDVILTDNLPDIEKKIILEERHFNRGDVNGYFIRSTQSRVKFKGNHFAIFNAVEDIKKGDILIDSSEYGHYAGELQIATKDMKNSGKTNVVGRIKEDEIFILDYIKPWQKFNFKIGA